MTLEPFIVCDELVKIYKIEGVEVIALQGLNLAVRRGEMLGIVGASGSGKSTLMNILGGLDRPTSGRVWVAEKNLLEMNDQELTQYRKRQVGFIWQQGARNLIPFLSALENIELPMALAGVSAGPARSRAGTLLEAVGLTDRAKFQLAQLSGGEQQRVAIAVALANQPALLLADEPTGELDSNTALTIFQAFQALNKQFNVTILVVSHDPGIARHMNRVVAIHDGQITAETIRHPVALSEGTVIPAGGGHLEELVVVDGNGWLHVPKAYLQQCQIEGRARLEITPDGLLIRPVSESLTTSELGEAAKRLAAERSRAEPGGLQRFLLRWGRRIKGKG